MHQTGICTHQEHNCLLACFFSTRRKEKNCCLSFYYKKLGKNVCLFVFLQRREKIASLSFVSDAASTKNTTVCLLLSFLQKGRKRIVCFLFLQEVRKQMCLLVCLFLQERRKQIACLSFTTRKDFISQYSKKEVNYTCSVVVLQEIRKTNCLLVCFLQEGWTKTACLSFTTRKDFISRYSEKEVNFTCTLLNTRICWYQAAQNDNGNNEELLMVTMAQTVKAPQTGATPTLTWITHNHSHTYINTVTTT